MLITFITSLTLSLAATLILASRPLFLGVWIVLITLSLGIITNLITITWLGLIILLIYIGGLLVIFAYFVALTPNLIIEGKSMFRGLIFSVPIFFIFVFSSYFADQKAFSSVSQQPMSFIFREHFTIISILALTLFFALVATVKIVSNMSSPLRPYN